MAGFIKLHRQFCGWEWYRDIAVKSVFVDLLMTANYEDSGYMGHTVKRGQAVFGYASLAERSGVTVQQARTAIKKLQKTGEITVWTNRHFSIATIVKFDEYQQTNNKPITNNQQTNNKPITNNQQTNNKQITSSKNIRIEEVKNIYPLHTTSRSEVSRDDFEDRAERVLELFREICTGFVKPDRLTDHRRRLIWIAETNGVDFKALFEKAQASDFLTKESRCRYGIDWVLEPKNRQKITEGNFVNKEKPPDKRGTVFSAEGASFDMTAYGSPEGCG